MVAAYDGTLHAEETSGVEPGTDRSVATDTSRRRSRTGPRAGAAPADAEALELAVLRARLQQAERDLAAARRGQNWLFEALDHVPEALVLLDADDRFVYWNRRYAELYIRPGDGVVVGSSFEDLLRAGLDRGHYVDAIGREDAWLEARMRRHRTSESSHEQQTSDGGWVRVEHRRLSDGGSIGIRTDITELKRNMASFRLLFDGSPVAMLVFDRTSLKILAANEEALRIYGFTSAGLLNRTMGDIGLPARDGGPPDDPLAGGSDRIRCHLRADGSTIRVRLCSTRLTYQGIDAAVCAVVDMSTVLQVEDDLQQARMLLDSLVESIPLTVFAKDMQADGRYVIFNKAAEAITARSRTAVLGLTDVEIFGPEGERYRQQDREIMATGLPQIMEETALWGDAPKRVLTNKLPIFDRAAGPPRYLLGIQEDVTERRRIEERLVHMAHHDALTDLPNRVLFRQHLGDAIADRAGGSVGFAVHSIDLDRFKTVNDEHGHGTGDALLAKVAERLRLLVRPSDRVARLGGDEFAILQNPVATIAEATRFARRVVDLISAPYTIGGLRVDVGASIGVAPAPDELDAVDTILRQADLALYQAKLSGGSRVCVFEEIVGANAIAHRALEHDLRRAVEMQGFELHYQPLYCLARRSITGFEALLRWNHPQRGFIPPLDFLPLAEEIGLIEAIGTWVLEEACRQAATWPEDLRIAVNLSPLQIQSGDLAATVMKALKGSGLAPRRLELEITESVLLVANEQCLSTMNLLRGIGISLSLDDFGTGYSSLSYLRMMPFDRIKIDRSFVSDLGQNPGCLAIVRAVVGLSSSLGIVTTAEGVETPEQLRQLRAEGCHEVQGYWISRPLPADELAPLLGDSRVTRGCPA